MREKVGKSRNTVFFRRFVAPEGRKVGSLKRRVHAVVARSIFASQNAQNTSAPDHFWKLRCRKSARRCGAKHISKSNSTKHLSFGPLLEVAMWKKCTPLWREAHFQVKMYKTHLCRTTFGSCDVEKVHAVVARRCAKHISKSKCTKHHMFAPLLEVRMLKKCTSLWREAHFEVNTKHHMFAPLLEVRMLKKCAPLWREAHFEVKMLKTLEVRTTFGGSDVASLRFTRSHYITLHYTPLHYTTLHYNYNYTTTLHYTSLH